MQQFLIILLSSKAMHKSSDGHLFIHYEKNPSYQQNLLQLLIMFTDINISTTLVGLYILTSAMTTGRAISSKEVKYPMRRVDKRSSNYCITRSIFTTLYI